MSSATENAEIKYAELCLRLDVLRDETIQNRQAADKAAEEWRAENRRRFESLDGPEVDTLPLLEQVYMIFWFSRLDDLPADHPVIVARNKTDIEFFLVRIELDNTVRRLKRLNPAGDYPECAELDRRRLPADME